jgi:hypothetical protein
LLSKKWEAFESETFWNGTAHQLFFHCNDTRLILGVGNAAENQNQGNFGDLANSRGPIPGLPDFY